MKQHDVDYLLYAMTHVARNGLIAADRQFAEQMAQAVRNPWFKPSKHETERMTAVENRFYGGGGGA